MCEMPQAGCRREHPARAAAQATAWLSIGSSSPTRRLLHAVSVRTSGTLAPTWTKKRAPEPGNSCGRRKRITQPRGLGRKLDFRASDLSLDWPRSEVRGPTPVTADCPEQPGRRSVIASLVPSLHPVGLLFAHLVEILLLVVVQHALDLSVGALPNLLHLAEPVLAGQRRIIANPVHLLALVLEDGFQFRLLVIAQVQLLAQMLELIVHRRHVTVAHMPSHAWAGLLVGLLTAAVAPEAPVRPGQRRCRQRSRD